MTHPCSVRTCAVVFIVQSYFVEIVLVELPHKTCEVAVLEVFREDVLGELLVLQKSAGWHRTNVPEEGAPRGQQSCLPRYPI